MNTVLEDSATTTPLTIAFTILVASEDVVGCIRVSWGAPKVLDGRAIY